MNSCRARPALLRTMARLYEDPMTASCTTHDMAALVTMSTNVAALGEACNPYFFDIGMPERNYYI
eukprot:5761076-Karenia_brevis.AAC.1